MDHNHFYFMGM